MFSKKDLRSLIIPLVIEQALALSIGMIDTAMVAGIGDSAIAGVSLVETINILLINLFAALATGGAILVAQYMGQKEFIKGTHAAKQLIMITGLISFIIMLVCVLLNGVILSVCFSGVEIDVMTQAKTYFYLTALSYPSIAIYNAIAALFRSMGDSKKAMVNALIMNGINIVGNAIFIYVFNWGVFGAALSTTISRWLVAIVMVYMLRNPQLDIHIQSYHLRDFDMPMVKEILHLGIPNGLENSMFQIGKIIMTTFIAGLGTASVAANAIAGSFAAIQVIPGMALSYAILTVVGQCIGADEKEKAKEYAKYLMKLAYGGMVILNIPILIFLKPLLGLFPLSSETVVIATSMLILHGIGCMTIWPISFTLPNTFRAAGDVSFPMAVSIATMWIFRVGLGFICIHVLGLGALSVWVAMVIDWCARSACFIWRWYSNTWLKNTSIPSATQETVTE